MASQVSQILVICILFEVASLAISHSPRRSASIVVSIGGKVVCRSNPGEAANITVELKDAGAVSFFDHLIDSKKTDAHGRFELSGVAEDHWFMGGKIEPYLHIPSHHCNGEGNNVNGEFTWKKVLTPIKASEFKEGFDYGKEHTFIIDATDVDSVNGVPANTGESRS